MEEKLRVIIGDRTEKLVLPSGIPPTVEELQTTVKENFGLYEEFSFQYLDSEFGDYFTVHKTDQIKHKDTLKVVYVAPIILNLQQIDAESSLSNAESSAGTSSSRSTIILPRSTTERCQPWPNQFPIPQFAYETDLS